MEHLEPALHRFVAEAIMPDDKWGHCQHCKYFASPAVVPLEEEEARCLQPVLSKFALLVFGACGCNSFELRAGTDVKTEEPVRP